MTEAKEYTCAACGGKYFQAWSDEEAMEEYKKDFPEAIGLPASKVCDDCYNKFTRWRVR